MASPKIADFKEPSADETEIALSYVMQWYRAAGFGGEHDKLSKEISTNCIKSPVDHGAHQYYTVKSVRRRIEHLTEIRDHEEREKARKEAAKKKEVKVAPVVQLELPVVDRRENSQARQENFNAIMNELKAIREQLAELRNLFRGDGK